MTHQRGQCPGWHSVKYTKDQCRPCHQARNVATFRGTEKAPPRTVPATPVTTFRRLRRLPCVERGEPLNRPTSCEKTWTWSCHRHDSCNHRRCDDCGDYRSDADPANCTRHLIYFIWPLKAGRDVWQANLDELAERLPLFNGRRVIAISTGSLRARKFNPPGLDSPEMVMEYFGKHDADFLDVPTLKVRKGPDDYEPKRGETTAFPLMMERLQPHQSDRDFTFYAHAKGVSRGGLDSSAFRWARLMYRINLDHWDRVAATLRDHPMAGAFRCGAAGHHYPGTYFWFRNDAVLSRDWRAVLQAHYAGVERWPGMMFAEDRLGNLFGDGKPTGLYDPAVIAEQERRYDAFRAELSDKPRVPLCR